MVHIGRDHSIANNAIACAVMLFIAFFSSSISYHLLSVLLCLLFDLRYHSVTFHTFAIGIYLTKQMQSQDCLFSPLF